MIFFQLFDHIASCLAMFMEEHDLKDREKLPLGFTFSFPCKQEGLTHAKLVNWTKGFNASNVEGKDVVGLLREACKRRGVCLKKFLLALRNLYFQDIDIDVVAVLNDTTGTMMACAFKENSCNIGVIAGTGSNACYMEKLEKVPKLEGEIDPNDGDPAEVDFKVKIDTKIQMCINTEWGAFGDDGSMEFIRTKYDKIIDERSINKGQQL